MHTTSVLILTSSILFLLGLVQVNCILESNWDSLLDKLGNCSSVLKIVNCLEAEGILISKEILGERQFAALNLSGGLRNLFLRFQNALNILFGSGASDLSLVLILALGVVPALIGLAAAMAFILGPGTTALISLLIPLAGFGFVLLPALTLMQIPQVL